VAAYAQKGSLDKAAAAKERLLRIEPSYSIGTEKARLTSDDTTYRRLTDAHFIAGLRKAGVPE